MVDERQEQVLGTGFVPRSEGVETVEVGQELVLVDEYYGCAYALNPIASFVWSSLADGLTLAAIVDELAPAFDAPTEVIAADVSKLAGDLCSLLLIASEDSEQPDRLVADECVLYPEELSDVYADVPEVPTFDDRYLVAPPNY